MRAPSSGRLASSRVAVWGLVFAVAVGAMLRLWHLPSNSLYLDEAFVFEAARMPAASMLRFLAEHDAHPPLFYLLTHVAVATLGWQPTWYRFLTAPFGLLTIVFTWAIARRAFGDVASAVAAIVVATEPTLILFDRLYRMYAILTALSAGSFWLMTSALAAEHARRRWLWVAYAIVAAVILQLQYLGAIVIASQGLYALFDVRKRWPILASGATALLALTPWLWIIERQWPQAGFAGGQAPGSPWTLARDVLGYGIPIGWYHTVAFDWPFTIGVVAFLIAGLWLGRGGIVGLYVTPLVIQGIATALFHRNLLYGRYLIYLIPGFALACAAVTAALLRTKARIAGMVVLAAILALNGVADTNLLLDKFYQLSDWNTVETLLSSNERQSDVIVFDQMYSYLVLRSSPFVASREIRGPQSPADIAPVMRWIDSKADRRVWYVENQRFYSDPGGEVKKHLDATRPRLRAWLEVRADPSNIVYVALYGPERGPSR